MILMTPKSLLGKPEAVSRISDFEEGSCFQEVLPDPMKFANPDAVGRIIFCSGKVYYDLIAHRDEHGIDSAAIIRIEQLYPFHEEMVEAIIGNIRKLGNLFGAKKNRSIWARGHISSPVSKSW